MKKTRFLCLLLALLLLVSAVSCAKSAPPAPSPSPSLILLPDEPEEPSSPAAPPEETATPGSPSPDPSPAKPDRDGYYYDLEGVILYLDAYGELPDNFVTKKEARDLGWSGGSVEKYLEGAAIGGDRFGNSDGLLPDGRYFECDIDTLGAKKRGAKRLVYSSDGRYYYTDDHYDSFTEYRVNSGEAVPVF